MTPDELTSTFIEMRERLHRSAAAILRSDTEADDVLQDAFVKSWQSDHTRDSGHRRAGLVVSVRNLCIDRLRRKRATIADPMPDTADSADPASDLEARQRLDEVMAWMRVSLSDINRRVFEMYVIDDMSYDDIARSLGISVDTARTCVSRARKKIRERFKN
ncbi:MAG: sigma-70 family RNA polymerase sigma factor [Bacteroidales bacterium]|nr:sigma-70 family RNA polymerase sigma factor [Bacteroidales bacterium]